VISADPDDNSSLETASAALAETIISGDTPLLDLADWNSTPILIPATYKNTFISTRLALYSFVS
jgi:predicted nucleic acid-binding protein